MDRMIIEVGIVLGALILIAALKRVPRKGVFKDRIKYRRSVWPRIAGANVVLGEGFTSNFFLPLFITNTQILRYMKLHMTPMREEDNLDVLLKRMYYLEHLLYELLQLCDGDRQKAKARCYDFDNHVLEHNRLEIQILGMVPNNLFNQLNQIKNI